MRFYLDEDQSDKIAQIARSRGLDVTSAIELQRRAIPDDKQLLFAAEEGRCLVTRNGRHFREQTDAFMAHGLPHAGVLVVTRSLRGDRYVGVVDALEAYARRYPDGVPPYFFDYLHPAET